jgi:hypothetical protein
MFSRMKIGLKRAYQTYSYDGDLPVGLMAMPRLWVVLLVLALPFFAICVDYFEALERSGTMGAIIADISLPASLIGYMVLLVVFKKRKI